MSAVLANVSAVDSRTIQMFAQLPVAAPSIEERMATAIDAITEIFRNSHVACISTSLGKDSSAVTALALHAAVKFKQSGGDPYLIVMTSRTLTENPEIDEHALLEHAKIREFAKKHSLRIRTHFASPTFSSSFVGKTLSGRGLPSYAGGSSDCTSDLKTGPMRSARKKIFREIKSLGLLEPITLIGTRFDESDSRRLRMSLRGERADQPVRNKDGDLVLSPIAHWSTDEVWECLGLAAAGSIVSYSDFADTRRIYAHAANTSCAVVADAIYEGGAKMRKGGCGTRTGCWTCLKAEDKSLENLIAFDDRYKYAAGLNKFNKYLRAIRFDWSKRHWVGRTIKGGFVKIEPDTFHPSTIRDLTRFLLQLDHDEAVRARRAGERPKFCNLPADVMIALDAMQSLNGVAKPYQIWADHRDITEGKVRYEIPEIEEVKQTPMPEARFLYVGRDWDDVVDAQGRTGLRNPYLEALTELSACAPEIIELPSGRSAWKVDTGSSFEVHEESVGDFLAFELDRVLEKYDAGMGPGGITEAYHYYHMLGVLQLSFKQQAHHAEVASRTAHKSALGLCLDYKVADLLARSIAFSEMPADARKAWANKATTESAQSDFLSLQDEAASLVPA